MSAFSYLSRELLVSDDIWFVSTSPLLPISLAVLFCTFDIDTMKIKSYNHASQTQQSIETEFFSDSCLRLDNGVAFRLLTVSRECHYQYRNKFSREACANDSVSIKPSLARLPTVLIEHTLATILTFQSFQSCQTAPTMCTCIEWYVYSM